MIWASKEYFPVVVLKNIQKKKGVSKHLKHEKQKGKSKESCKISVCNKEIGTKMVRAVGEYGKCRFTNLKLFCLK